MFTSLPDKVWELISYYVIYLVAACTVFTATVLIVATKHSPETAVEIAIVIFIIGPAAGFLGKTVYNFLAERFG